MCSFYIQFNNLQNLFIYDKITTKNMLHFMLQIIPEINNKLPKVEHFQLLLIKTIIPSFHTSQAATEQPLCFKSFIMASHQSVVNINIITKFPIGHKAFVSLCTLCHCALRALGRNMVISRSRPICLHQ